MDLIKTQVIKKLEETKCLKSGEFKLKSGIVSPVYIDLRYITMNQELFSNIIELIRTKIPKDKAHPPVAIVGVPYGAVPVASAVAFTCGLTYYPLRKETKDYGVKPDSGAYTDYEYIIIEDVISTGSSIVETLQKLEGRTVTDVIVIVDRQLGGMKKLKDSYPQIRFHSIFTIKEIQDGVEKQVAS